MTAPNSFEMTFDANVAGGAIATFHDLAEDPGRANDLVGSLETSNGPRGLHSFGMAVAGISYNSSNNIAGARLDVLESTPTRVRVRQEAFYQQGPAGAILAGVKGIGDYSVYPAGRTALRWERRTTSPVTYTAEYDELVVHRLAVLPLSGWATYRGLGTIPPAGTGNDAFLMAQNEQAGARTDFLQILHRDWTIANGYPGTADLTDATTSAPSERINMYWDELTGAALAAGASHVWNSLTYFKPTDFLNQGDAAVTARSTDYRTPAVPTINLSKGSQWQDAGENTGSVGDFFNESEAAYAFDLNPGTGLDFSLDGSANTRYSPFFKIRQWRSAVAPQSITVGGVTKTRDIDYRADVKPVSFAVFADSILWHSTLESAAALTTTPDIGSGGTMGAGVTFPAGRYGNGAQVPNNNDWISFPTSGFDKVAGAVEFWFQPTWASNDGARHDMGGFFFNATNQFLLQKLADNSLHFTIVTSAGTSDLVVTAANYGWRAADWVHIVMQWNDALSLANQQVLYVNGVRPVHTDPAVDYNSALLTPDTDFYVGNISGIGSASYADGIYDEVYSYSLSALDPSQGILARAGLLASPLEFLASPSSNATLSLNVVNGTRQGEYLYLATDSRFRGLNVVLATAGVGTANLQWQFWNGAVWADLEAVGGFTDTTNNLERNGNISWTADPPSWSPSSFAGGPDLYYVRAYVASGLYTTAPVESRITTDILLFQYCADVTTNSNFVFAPAVTTEVKLQSFSAFAGDGSVVLEWRTASELDNLGFHLYRGPSSDGPWAQLTASLIPGLGSSAVGQAYSYRDAGLANGTRYFYRLEDVDASSKTTSHGPVSAVPVAGAPGGAPGSEPQASSPSAKRKAASSASCPGWVVASYGSAAGASSSSALTCTRHGDPEAVSLSVVSRDSRQATLELRTGGFYALHTLSGAGEPAGTVRVFVPGFDFPQDGKAVALPVRRALADAVVGRRVQLAGVRALDLVSFKGLVPSALGKPEMQVGQDGTVRAARRDSARAARLFPKSELVTLLPSVFQGEKKSAVLEIAPLRFEAQRRQLVLAKRVLVRLLFTGRESGESGQGSRGRARGSRKPVVSGEVLARLFTTSRGLYSASFEQLFPGQRRGWLASQLRLERQGEPVGFHLEPASDAFGPGSRILFYADRGAVSTDFSAEIAYELVRSASGVVMPVQSATPGSNAITTASIVSRSFETNKSYQPGLLDAPDPWLWEALASGATRVKSFALTGVSGIGTAQLDVDLQGASEFGNPVDHHVSVSLNGTLVGEAQFAGKAPYRMGLSLPATLLREGSNDLQLANVADTGVSSLVFLDRFSLAHPQLAAMTSGLFEGTWAEGGTATVSGLTGSAAIIDLPAEGNTRWLSGYVASGGSVRFRAEAGRRYLVASQESLLTPRVAAVEPTTLRATTNQADYILIAPRAFLAAAEPLVDRRQDQGLSTRAVAFEEIACEFGHGQPSAEAIRSFLAYAFQSWTRPSPRYVVLLGDANYDPRNFMGTSPPSPLPALWAKTSYLWTVSDPQLAAVNGDDPLPDLAIGRLPAASVEQAQALVQKLLTWEDSGQGLGGQAALVADNPDLAGDFEADVKDIAQSYLSGHSPELLLLSELGPEMRSRILDALNGGLSFLSYVGHGGAAVWASENVWNSWDAPSLQAQSQQPFLVTMNCLNGYFVAPAFESLSESLLKAEGRGAIASFSPSGLSLDGPAHQYQRALMAELTGGRHARLGDAILAAQTTYANSGLMPELLGVYHLLGDPATKIR
ncbi:MAG TPA: C25 family cysteine peptidase [Vicinamibacteria bacterium]|nr:C25 family cysteine peptidase [Vicinamibacteria bacterium]